MTPSRWRRRPPRSCCRAASRARSRRRWPVRWTTSARTRARARAFVLIEDEPGEVTVTVRDDGAGMAHGRLDEAAGDGRLGVARSIRGRVRDLGGAVTITSAPGDGTEVEIRIPRQSRGS
ncbi:ATP-binding protein [Luedemannella helvata]|uniref:ATP-binding protein n=1 Tax=Luedemannella helvata TaxID=349315 RepID=UPI0031CE1517